MKSALVAFSLIGFLFGIPSDKQAWKMGRAKVMAEYVAPPAFDALKLYRQGRRWTVCGAATGQLRAGRTGNERFIADKTGVSFSGDPAFAESADGKEAFEALWKTRCVKRR